MSLLSQYALREIWKQPFSGSVVDWCESNLRFDEAGNHGGFKTAGAEYVRDVLEDFARLSISDQVLVWGSQARKTGTLMGGIAWCIANDPCGILWVLPNVGLARRFSRQRWRKMLLKSSVADLIPTGSARHLFSTQEQLIGGTTINFVGSNAAAGLASNPCRRVVLDEVEKFNEAPNAEADAVNLAQQRTKDQYSPQRWKTSTPSLPTGLIWREFLKGSQSRYYIPCPRCRSLIVLAWSPQYTTFEKTGDEAYVHWEGKQNGSYDFDVVRATAHALCPKCAFKIKTEHKAEAVAKGAWKPLIASERAFISRHLPSLYSTSTQCSFGELAVKFLKAVASPEGVQGFVNGDLAEPYAGQDKVSIRSERLAQGIEVFGEGWVPIMSIDCQQKSPYFWYTIRQWGAKKTAAIASGSAETWEELHDIQVRYKVDTRRVIVDSGFGAKSEADVYRNCARYCDIWTTASGEVLMSGQLARIIGWVPAKGIPGRRKWKDPETGVYLPFFRRIVDPFLGTSKAGQYAIELLEYSTDAFSDIMDNLAENKKEFLWTVNPEAATETYWKHWDSEIKTWMVNRRTNKGYFSWQLRSASLKNHLRDCEKQQVVAAAAFGYLPLE